MHSYIRTLGFSKLKTKSEQNKLITAAFHDATKRMEIEIGSNIRFLQVDRDFGGGLGISMIGEIDDTETFTLDHAFPYCRGVHTTSQEDLQIEPHTDKESYSIISEDYNLGMTLIYGLQNIGDYVKATWSNTFMKKPEYVKLGALSIEGRILYGVHLDHVVCPYDKQPISNKERRNLVAKARSGDMDALENLTLDDMDTYALASKRIKDEDLFTVVETYFMPFGIDNEHYSVLGIIKKIDKIVNEFSDEIVYNLTISCNDILMNVAINALDLHGEPQIGRRFKGIIWLQGQVDFMI